MNKLLTPLLLLPLLSNALNAAEENIKRQDFNYQAELIVVSAESVQHLELPEYVQNKLHHQAAQDVRVFNAKGELMPTLIQYQTSQHQPSIVQSIVFFPLQRDAIEQQKAIVSKQQQFAVKLEVLLNAENDNVESKENIEQPNQPQSYIIENPEYDENGVKSSADQTQLYQINIHLDPEFDGIAALTLETSNDLNNWQLLVANDSVTHINYRGQQLHKNAINFSGKANRYLKLNWTGTNQPTVKSIDAVLGQGSLKPVYVWSDNLIFKPVVEEGIASNTYQFTVSPAFRTDKIRLLESNSDQIVSGLLSSNHSANKHWMGMTRFQFYHIKNNDNTISVMESSIQPNNNENWRIQFQYPINNAIDDLAFQVNRYPVQLYFLKQGTGPYYLAFGNPSIGPMTDTLSKVMQNVLKISAANYGEASLSTIEKNVISPVSAFAWKKILLWIVLVAGVVIMLWMARSLFKQMTTD